MVVAIGDGTAIRQRARGARDERDRVTHRRQRVVDAPLGIACEWSEHETRGRAGDGRGQTHPQRDGHRCRTTGDGDGVASQRSACKGTHVVADEADTNWILCLDEQRVSGFHTPGGAESRDPRHGRATAREQHLDRDGDAGSALAGRIDDERHDLVNTGVGRGGNQEAERGRERVAQRAAVRCGVASDGGAAGWWRDAEADDADLADGGCSDAEDDRSSAHGLRVALRAGDGDGAGLPAAHRHQRGVGPRQIAVAVFRLCDEGDLRAWRDGGRHCDREILRVRRDGGAHRVGDGLLQCAGQRCTHELDAEVVVRRHGEGKDGVGARRTHHAEARCGAVERALVDRGVGVAAAREGNCEHQWQAAERARNQRRFGAHWIIVPGSKAWCVLRRHRGCAERRESRDHSSARPCGWSRRGGRGRARS